MTSVESAFQSRSDLQVFNDNARLLFALELRYQLDDIATVAANALTDGYDDKKCDLIYVEPELGLAIIAQGYESNAIAALAIASGVGIDSEVYLLFRVREEYAKLEISRKF